MKFLPLLIVVTTSCLIFLRFQFQNQPRDRLAEFLNLDIMMELPQRRRPFTFSITPWKITASKPLNSAVKRLEKETRWSLVVFVKSHSSHRSRRVLARMTWSSFEMIDGVRLETVFIVGNPDSEQERLSIENEHRRYGDLLQIDLEEKYTSIGFKTLAGMQYASSEFPSDWMYVSADDDMLPDWTRIVDEVDKMRNSTRSTAPHNSCELPGHLPIMCGFGTVVHPRAQRSKSSKWYLSSEEYGPYEFPTYCLGGFYMMTVKLVGEIYQVSRWLPFFWIDDVWVTGFLRLKVHIHPLCPRDPDVGLWSNSKEPFSFTGTEREILRQWTGYVAKIHERTYIYGDADAGSDRTLKLPYQWAAWLDYVLDGRIIEN